MSKPNELTDGYGSVPVELAVKLLARLIKGGNLSPEGQIFVKDYKPCVNAFELQPRIERAARQSGKTQTAIDATLRDAATPIGESKFYELAKDERVNAPTAPTAADFIEAVIALFKLYGMSISHEDDSGEFIIEDYDERNSEWLRRADIHRNEEKAQCTSKGDLERGNAENAPPKK